jgi:hypothetical protein
MRQPTTNLTKAEKQEVVTNCDHLAPETLFDRSTPLQTN